MKTLHPKIVVYSSISVNIRHMQIQQIALIELLATSDTLVLRFHMTELVSL